MRIAKFLLAVLLCFSLVSCNSSSTYNGKPIKSVELKENETTYHHIEGDFFNSPEKIILKFNYEDNTSEEKELTSDMFSKERLEKLNAKPAGSRNSMYNFLIYDEFNVIGTLHCFIGKAENEVILNLSDNSTRKVTVKFGEPLEIPSDLDIDSWSYYDNSYYYEFSHFGNDDKFLDINHIYYDTELWPKYSRFKKLIIKDIEEKEIYSETIEYVHDKEKSDIVPKEIDDINAYAINIIKELCGGSLDIEYYDDEYHYVGCYFALTGTNKKDICFGPLLNETVYYTVNFYDSNNVLLLSKKVDEGDRISKDEFPKVNESEFYDDEYHYIITNEWHVGDNNYKLFSYTTDIYENFEVYQTWWRSRYYTVSFYNDKDELIYEERVNEDEYINNIPADEEFAISDGEFVGFDINIYRLRITEDTVIHAKYYYRVDDYLIEKNDNDKTCSIIMYEGSNSKITIPDTLGEYKVINICYGALSNTQVNNVTIANEIESAEYLGIENLEYIELPLHLFACFKKSDEVIIHQGSALKFPDNFGTKLQNTKVLRFADDVTVKLFNMSQSYVLNGMSSIEELECLGSVSLTNLFGRPEFDNTYSIDGLFYIPTSLRKVIITNSNICDYFAYNCNMIEEIIIKDSNTITSIGKYAFAGLDKVKNIIVPDHVLVISSYAFSNMSSLETVTLGKNTHNIYQFAFSGCDSLTNVYLDYKDGDNICGWYKISDTNQQDIEKVIWQSSSELAAKLSNEWKSYAISWIE